MPQGSTSTADVVSDASKTCLQDAHEEVHEPGRNADDDVEPTPEAIEMRSSHGLRPNDGHAGEKRGEERQAQR